jgi:hypothetical protein
MQLVRPADRARFAFALTVVLCGAMVLYMVNSASFDERYIVYLAPMLLLPATLAIARREVSPAGLGIASVLLALLLVRVKWDANQGDFGFFVSPAEMFYGRGIAERLDVSVPGNRGTILTLLPIALAIAGVWMARGLWRNPGRLTGRAGALIMAVVALTIVIETQYTLSKYVNTAGSKSAPGLSARAFADKGTPSGARIGEFAEGAGKGGDFVAVWKEVQFYNQRIDRVYSLGPNVNAVPPGDELVDNVGFDPDTGLLHSPKPLPDYLVIPTPVGVARVAGEQLPSPRYIPVALVKIARPARLAWSTSGLDTSAVVSGTRGTVRIYGAGLRAGGHCATIDLGAPADGTVSWRARLAHRKLGSGRLKPGKLQRVIVPLPDLAARPHVDVTLGGRPRVLAVYVDQYC